MGGFPERSDKRIPERREFGGDWGGKRCREVFQVEGKVGANALRQEKTSGKQPRLDFRSPTFYTSLPKATGDFTDGATHGLGIRSL